MQRIRLTTLVDITCSNVKRPGQGEPLEQHQYRNWTTLLQAVGLRSNISFEHNPTVEEQSIESFKFGKKHTGEQRVWTFEFSTDQNDIYLDNGDPLALLFEDLHNVPIIKNLLETINIDRAVFDLKHPDNCNTTISLV